MVEMTEGDLAPASLIKKWVECVPYTYKEMEMSEQQWAVFTLSMKTLTGGNWGASNG